ncbi:type II toxin-antitoxin system ParD family antitoxin [Isosphaeraceae bacterium EP7]
MDAIYVNLPEEVKSYVQSRIAAGEYQDMDEYFLSLILADQDRHAIDRLDDELRKGLNSGEPIPLDDRFWEEKRRKIIETYSKVVPK